jgi:hypothetical protein
MGGKLSFAWRDFWFLGFDMKSSQVSKQSIQLPGPQSWGRPGWSGPDRVESRANRQDLLRGQARQSIRTRVGGLGGLPLFAILIFSLMLSSIQPALAQADDELPATDFAACDNLSEEELRSELNTLAQSIFDQNGGVDLTAIVERQWQLHDMDAVVDVAVAHAVDVVQRDDELWNTFLSGWSPGKAEELAETVAIVAFDSETFRQALDELVRRHRQRSGE